MTGNPTSRPFQYTIRNILRAQAGLAGIIAVAVYVHTLKPGWSGTTIFGPWYAICTVFWCVVGYLIARCFFGRFTAFVLSMAFATFASCTFARPKYDHPRDFAILGMVVAISAFLGFGWLDRMTIPFLRWKGVTPSGSAIAEPRQSPKETARRQ